MYPIDYNSYRSIKGFNSRIRFLVLHYTAQDFATSVESLTGNNVSVHYLVPDPEDKSYQLAGYSDIKIFNIVDEKERAWHAGVSSWGNRTNLNDTSIGIEVVNVASEENGIFTFPPYNDRQIEAVIMLAKNILQRYPDISPVNVVGHSDIAAGRKSDPGAAFPWEKLYREGIGAWFSTTVRSRYRIRFLKSGIPPKEEIIKMLKIYGYDTSGATDDEGYRMLIRAFQLHFRQEKYDGEVDVETAAILHALVEKYFPDALE